MEYLLMLFEALGKLDKAKVTPFYSSTKLKQSLLPKRIEFHKNLSLPKMLFEELTSSSPKNAEFRPFL
jgi:hypothetical protein